jgi:tetratricopeptide (TPR) repeat protein
MYNIAQTFARRSKYQVAKEWFERSLSQSLQLQASIHTVKMLHNIGLCCYHTGQMSSAVARYQEALHLVTQLAPSDNKTVIETILSERLIAPLNHVAQHYRRCGQYRESLLAYRKMYTIQVQAYGEENLSVASTLSNIGLMHFKLQQLDDAYVTYKETLRIRCALHEGTPDHPDISFTLNALGLVLFHQERLDLAHRCFRECLQLRESLLGSDHPEVAISWYNIASVDLAMGDEESALQCYKSVLTTLRKSRKPNHPDIILILQHLGKICRRLGQVDESLAYYWEVVGLLKSLNNAAVEDEDEDEDDDIRALSGGRVPGVGENRNIGALHAAGSILDTLGNLYLEQGKLESMMECFIEASRIWIHHCGPLSSADKTLLVVEGYEFHRLREVHPPGAAMA